jgi:hypothetical protein
MKLFGMAMARNECDVIEAFVRHNLTVLDGLLVVDHGSMDATPKILAAMVREGLPLEVASETRLEFRQSEVVSAAVRRLLANGADFVFLLDSDEFLKVPSRSRLEAALSSLPQGMHAVQEWHTYVPDFSRPLDSVAIIRSARRVASAQQGLYKAVVSRHFLDSPAVIAEGNHWVQTRQGEGHATAQHARLLAEESSIAHVPIRSAAQFRAKMAVGWLACLMQHDRPPSLCYHWGEAYADLREGKPLTPETLSRVAGTYGLPEGQQKPPTVELVDDPFLADISLRYQGATRVRAFPLVLQFAEQLAKSVANAKATGFLQSEVRRERSESRVPS